MTDIDRRHAITLLAATPVAVLTLSRAELDRAAQHARRALERLASRGEAYAPKFFTAHEWRTVRMLSDLVIPRDRRSGSATDAGVPEFMDFIMTEYPASQKNMRDGLAWLDSECQRRHANTFVASTLKERTLVLDDIAWPRRARPEMKDGVTFFNSFRDLTASGFWSSRMGVKDLQYMGNTAIAEWKGCPPSALRKLGVSYRTK
ncbi:MAG: gluconate 2-dehydrogenase subunit 3 family protein [Gemmatimonadaceae bacterium]